jgi:ribonuclease E
LRIIEDEAARGSGERVCLRAGTEAAVYVLNKKRAELADIEQRYGVSIEIVIEAGFEGARMTVESSGPRPVAAPRAEPAPVEEEEGEEDEETLEISLEGEEREESEVEGEQREGAAGGERHGRRRRRRRRGGRGRGRREEGETAAVEQIEQERAAPAVEEGPHEEPLAEPVSAKRRSRRRGRKAELQHIEAVIEPDSSPMVERPTDEEPPIAETEGEAQPKPKRRRSKKASDQSDTPPVEATSAGQPEAVQDGHEASESAPARKRRSKAKKEPELAEAEGPRDEAASVPAANNDTAADAAQEPRRGWWQRTFG